MDEYRRLIAQLQRENDVERIKVSEAVSDITKFIEENTVRVKYKAQTGSGDIYFL